MMAVLFGLLVLVAACTGGDGSSDDGADGDTPEDVAIGGDDLAAPALVLSEVAADGAALFPCAGEAGTGTVEIAYVQQLPVELVGPLADAFRAVVGDYQRRCGGVAAGSLEVTVGYADGGASSDVCGIAAVDGAAIVVVDAADDTAVACLGSPDRLVWHEGGASDPTSVAGTDAPPAVRASHAVAAALAEGVIGDRSVLVVHDGSPRRANAAEAGVVATLDAASVDAEIVAIACNGVGPGSDLDGAFVVSLLPADCLADLTAEAGSAGAQVRWLVVEDDLSLAPLDGVSFDVGAFDAALAYEFAPTMVTGLPRNRAPVSRDQACVEFLDELTGAETVFPSMAFTAHARLCSTVAGLLASVHAAGDAPTPAAVLAAIPAVAPELIVSQGLRRGESIDPWLAPAVFTTIEWNADCACWSYVRGPDLAPVD